MPKDRPLRFLVAAPVTLDSTGLSGANQYARSRALSSPNGISVIGTILAVVSADDFNNMRAKNKILQLPGRAFDWYSRCAITSFAPYFRWRASFSRFPTRRRRSIRSQPKG